MKPPVSRTSLWAQLGERWVKDVTSSLPAAILIVLGAVVGIRDALISVNQTPAIVLGALGICWAGVSLFRALSRAWSDSRVEVATLEAELALERAKRPRLVPAILGASYRAVEEFNGWLITTDVLVENEGSEGAHISAVESAVVFAGEQQISGGFQAPDGWSYLIHRNRLPIASLLSHGEIGPRAKIQGAVVGVFYNLSMTKFSDLVLMVRVRGVGCEWSDWKTFQPVDDSALDVTKDHKPAWFQGHQMEKN